MKCLFLKFAVKVCDLRPNHLGFKFNFSATDAKQCGI